MATKVKLRQKPISKNKHSLYLDFYPPIIDQATGKPTRREFLGFYLHSPIKWIKKGKKSEPIFDLNPIINKTYENHNKETLAVAESIKQKRQNILDKPEIYTGYEQEQLRLKEQGEQNFVEYFKKLVDKRKASNYDNWVSTYKYLDTFTKGTLRIKDLNEKFFNDFKEYLLTTQSNKSSKVQLSQNSAVSYFNKVKAAIKQAFKDGLIQTDLNAKIQPIKTAETQRNFLTIEELNQLVKTDCKNILLKHAAIFSALTGLRHSDIKKLTWSELEYIKGNGYFINYKQQKTKSVEMLPISEQAFSVLGERKNPTYKVFDGLEYSAYQNKFLREWVKAAGITKDITFHCFRHTFATLQLSKGTDIYTVSKMLTHKNVKTTQIYAKIIDETKRKAADSIQLDF